MKKNFKFQISPQTKANIKEYINVILFALILVFFSRTFIVEPFKIPSGSMKNTLLTGDHIFVFKPSYGIKIPFSNINLFTQTPKKGDLIVFKYPKNEKKDFIKRVIATPGDTLEIKRQKVYINDKPVNEDYARHTKPYLPPPYDYPRDNYGPITIPENKVFVMGDNREKSHDSRFWGFVDTGKISGRAFLIYWSWDIDKSRVRWKRIFKSLK